VLFTFRSYQLAVAYLYTSSKVPANEEFETLSWLKVFSVYSEHHTDEGGKLNAVCLGCSFKLGTLEKTGFATKPDKKRKE
jgi:hypothetical protein